MENYQENLKNKQVKPSKNELLNDTNHYEFKETLREVTFGKSLVEAVNDMQERIPSESINNIILSLNQANFYGNNVIDNLYQQVDYLREKRKMEVKAKISKLPIKISVISVLFFVPLMLLIIISPILLSYIK